MTDKEKEKHNYGSILHKDKVSTEEGNNKDGNKLEKENYKELLLNDNNKVKENFELIQEVGSGSESSVFIARHKKTKRIIALKILKKKKKNTINEMIISSKLKNKNIINFYQGYTKGKIDFLIMDFAKYGHLKEFAKKTIKRHVLSEQFLNFITLPILSALKYNYTCKIAHLDVKPNNIVIDEYLNVKLIDYSVALDFSKIKTKNIKLCFCGTSVYMAPEVMKTEKIEVKDLDKVDLYSLGITLYYLAFGKFPYDINANDINSNEKIYDKKTKNELKIENQNGEYSKHFINFLTRLLEKDINKRINLDEAMNNYWVKGAKILFQEKEKLYNCGCFLSYLITDYFKSFNDYISA